MTTAVINNRKNRIKRDRVFPIVNTVILFLLMFLTLYPVINTVAYSFNDGTDAFVLGDTAFAADGKSKLDDDVIDAV